MYEAKYRFALQNTRFEGFHMPLFQEIDGVKAASGEPDLKFFVDFGMGNGNESPSHPVAWSNAAGIELGLHSGAGFQSRLIYDR